MTISTWTIAPIVIIFFSIMACSNTDRHTDSEVKNLNAPVGSQTEKMDTSEDVTMLTSLPKGGSYNSNGRILGYRIFSSSVINNTLVPMELNINFPSDSLAMPNSDKYLKFFLPPDEISSTKNSEYNYGEKGIKSFFDGTTRSINLKTLIKPGEKYLFNSGVFFYPGYGVARARLFTSTSKDTAKLALSYSVSIGSNSLSIPCGEIILKK